MSWVRLDDGFPEHPKVSDLSDAAFRAFVEGTCFSARSKRDGGIPAALAHRLWSRKAIAEVVEMGLWHHGFGCGTETCIRGSEDGFVIHDFLDYNPSTPERNAKSDAASNAARMRWERESASDLALGDGVGVRVGGSKNQESAEFVEFYEQAFPRREGRGAARKAWAKASSKAPPSEIIAGARRFAADPNREPAYTPHPATWLNQERWGDDPLPPRNGQRSARNVTNLLARADALERSGR